MTASLSGTKSDILGRPDPGVDRMRDDLEVVNPVIDPVPEQNFITNIIISVYHSDCLVFC